MQENTSKLLLRLTVGFLMLFHGVAKVTHGVSFLEGMFTNAGLPSFFAYGAYVGEILAPLMLIFGYRVKIASLLIILTMIGAIALAHPGDIFLTTKTGAWAIELQMFYILTSIVIMLQGPGKYSLDYSRR